MTSVLLHWCPSGPLDPAPEDAALPEEGPAARPVSETQDRADHIRTRRPPTPRRGPAPLGGAPLSHGDAPSQGGGGAP